MIVLDETHAQPELIKPVVAPHLRKEAALVAETARADFEQAVKLQRTNFRRAHARLRGAGDNRYSRTGRAGRLAARDRRAPDNRARARSPPGTSPSCLAAFRWCARKSPRRGGCRACRCLATHSRVRAVQRATGRAPDTPG